ncbi:MAG: hypothetical protein JO303_16805 [Caulobacteraceae bacterium]|nr:hypothetical protein [Caulobacteraceae bacterium]
MRAAVLTGLCLALAACSKSTTTNIQNDIHNAGQYLKAGVQDIKDDPAWKHAGEDFKEAGHEAGSGLQHGADQAGDDARRAGQDIRDHAHRTAEAVKHDFHGGNS